MFSIILSVLFSGAAVVAQTTPFQRGPDGILNVVSEQKIEAPYFALKGVSEISLRGLKVTEPSPYPPFVDVYIATAETLCAQLNYHGVSGWRLPTLKEMFALSRLGLWSLAGYGLDEYFWVTRMTSGDYLQEQKIAEKEIDEGCQKAPSPRTCREIGFSALRESLDAAAAASRSVEMVNADIRRLHAEEKVKFRYLCVKN